MKLLSGTSRLSEPWKNGRGRTATVESEPDWRVSIAQVSDASAFSSFPGASRVITPISAAGLVLSIDGRRLALRTGEAAAFAGEDAVFAPELDEPAEVVNLIWQRDRCAGVLSAVSVEGSVTLTAEAAVLVAVVTAGRLTLSDGPELGRLDALRLDWTEAAVLSGRGALALARIMTRHADTGSSGAPPALSC